MTPREMIDFMTIIGKLKTTYRHCYTEGDRKESVADHSWRIALMAMLCEKEFPDAKKFSVDFPEALAKNRRCYEKAGFCDTGRRLEAEPGLVLAAYEKYVDNPAEA